MHSSQSRRTSRPGRWLTGLPCGCLGELLQGFELVLVPEMNNGQLVSLLRSEYLIPAEGISKVSGKPFKVSEIENTVRARLEC